MLHCKTQVSGRNDKNNFVVIQINFCRGTKAEIVYLGNIVFTFYQFSTHTKTDWFKLIFTQIVCPHAFNCFSDFCCKKTLLTPVFTK